MTEISFRSAIARDADAIRTCVEAAYAEIRLSIPDLPDVTDGIEEDIRDSYVLIAQKEEELLGVVVFGFVENALMIFNLAVSPRAKGQGLARRLLDLAEGMAKDKDYKALRLTTHRLMVETRAIYRHLGWRETGREANKVYFEKSV